MRLGGGTIIKLRQFVIGLLLITIMMMNSCMRIIIRHDPLTAVQHNDLGVAYLKEKQITAAENEFKAAIKKDKRYWLAYYNLGTLYIQNNRTKEAEQYFYKTVILNSTYSDAYNNLAFTQMKNKDFTHALYFANLAIKHATENKHLYLDTLVLIYEGLNNHAEACAVLRTLIEVSPNNMKESYQTKYTQNCNKAL